MACPSFDRVQAQALGNIGSKDGTGRAFVLRVSSLIRPSVNWTSQMLRTAIVAGFVLWTAPLLAADGKIPHVVLGLHGGIAVDKQDMTPGLEAQLRAALEQALRAGYEALARSQATGLDAVEAAIRVLEDSPLFNAGKGAAFTHEGRNELDASIMEGKTKRAGAVAGVTIIKNPITAARAVMDQSKQVLFIGRGAEVFATRAGVEIVDPSYFWTERRWRDIQRIWQLENQRRQEGSKAINPPVSNQPYGTVGAVALDRDGNLAAGTSTGGLTNKPSGRIGDSPIIGAGTYADNDGAAVSCTGHGEFFIRFAVAHEVNAIMKYRKLPIHEAADDVINRQLKAAGGEGGCIALDHRGNFTAAYNTAGMYRGTITTDGTVSISLYDK
jgi:beta-aspartyl-peptidase (threonine type)